MAYSSNMNKVLGKLEKDLRKIQNTEPVIQDIAVSLVADNTRRIHNEGENVAGNQIGQYAVSTKRSRSKRGRQVSFVDLSDTGQLSKDLVAEPIPGGGWVVGFVNPSGRRPTSGEIHTFQEKRYGEVWGISAMAQAIIQKILAKTIKIG